MQGTVIAGVRLCSAVLRLVPVLLAGLSSVLLADEPATGQTGRGNVVCRLEIPERYTHVRVPGSELNEGRSPVYTSLVTIDSSGRIDVTYSHLRADDYSLQYDAPLPWQFKSLRVRPEIRNLRVRQELDAAGRFTGTLVDFMLCTVADGEGLLEAKRELVPECVATRYGPAVRIVQTEEYGASPVDAWYVEFRSQDWPQLNSIPEKQFHVGNLQAAEFVGYDVGSRADEFPNRTFLRSHSGMVRVQRADGSWVKAEDNSDLNVGDRIKTLSNGRAEIVLAGTSMLRVKPDTEFVIPEGHTNTSEKVSFLRMIRGVLWARAKKDDDSLKVAVPNAVCGVRGTDFEVEVTADDHSCFWCGEGLLEVQPLLADRTSVQRGFTVAAGERKCVVGNRTEAAQPRLPVTVHVLADRDGQRLPVTGASVTLQPLDAAQPTVHDTSGAQGLALLLADTQGQYRLVVEAADYEPQQTDIRLTAGGNLRYDILLHRRPDAPPETPAQTPTALCSFDGLWMVHFYNNTSGTGELPAGQRMRILVSGDRATGYAADPWTQELTKYCAGPLSQNGQVWNATRVVDGQLSQYFKDVQLDPGCSRFVGRWGGEAPHDYAWIGLRILEAQPAKPVSDTVELTSRNPRQTLEVTPGSQITVKVATYSGSGLGMELVPLQTRQMTVTGPQDEPMQRPAAAPGRIVVGTGTWKVYRLQIDAPLTAEQQLRFQFFRTPGQTELEYVLTLRQPRPL